MFLLGAPCFQKPVPALMRIGSVDVRLGEEANLNDYSLPKSVPTMDTVEEVMQLFESGGKVTCFFFFFQVLDVNGGLD